MDKILVALLACIILSGCVTSEKYYTDPTKEGYTKSHFTTLCFKCNRAFNFSQALADKYNLLICPYCGNPQDWKMGQRAYNYDQAQRQQIENQQAMGMLLGVTQQMSQQSMQAEQNRVNTVSSFMQPIGGKRTNYDVISATGEKVGELHQQ